MMNSMFALKVTVGNYAREASEELLFMQQEHRQKTKRRDALDDLADYLQDDADLPRQKAEQEMLAAVLRSTVLMDTCAVVHEDFPLLMANMLPVLKETGKQILIPASVIGALKRLGDRNAEMRNTVRKTCGLLQSLQQQGVLRILPGNPCNFDDQDICTIADQYRAQADVLVITGDAMLAEDLVRCNDVTPAAYRVKVCTMTCDGFLAEYRAPEEQDGGVFRDIEPEPAEVPAAPAFQESCPEMAVSDQTAGQTEHTEICVVCGRAFVIPADEAEKLRSRGLALPKRCKICRHMGGGADAECGE